MRNTDESCCLDLKNNNFTGMGLEIALKQTLPIKGQVSEVMPVPCHVGNMSSHSNTKVKSQ